MCDCYDAPCRGDNCEETIPVHIGDFNFSRGQVEAWCGKHIPDEPGIQVFEIKDDEGDEYPGGMRFGIRLEGGRHHPDCEDVNINLCNVEPINQPDILLGLCRGLPIWRYGGVFDTSGK